MSTMNVKYFRGPFYIREKDFFHTYKIADCETNKLLRHFINAKDLKRYNDPLKYRIEPRKMKTQALKAMTTLKYMTQKKISL